MARPNLSAELTKSQIDEIKVHIIAIKSIFNFGVNLTPREREYMRKMGPKSVSYVELALSIAQNHSEIIPNGCNVSEFEKDVNLIKALQEIHTMLSPLYESFDDTKLLLGKECIRQADTIYSLVKLAAKNDETLNVFKSELGKRYKEIGTNRGNPKRIRIKKDKNDNK